MLLYPISFSERRKCGKRPPHITQITMSVTSAGDYLGRSNTSFITTSWVSGGWVAQSWAPFSPGAVGGSSTGHCSCVTTGLYLVILNRHIG